MGYDTSGFSWSLGGVGQTEIILWWGFIYSCWRSWSTPCLHFWWFCFYSFGVDPPALIWWADPPIFILNHPRLQRMKSLHSGRVQCMCSLARQRTVIGSLIYGWLVRDKWINVTVRGTGCVWFYFIFIYPIGFSDEIFENSFIVITKCRVDQTRLSHWHWSDLGAILAQDLISDLFLGIVPPTSSPMMVHYLPLWGSEVPPEIVPFSLMRSDLLRRKPICFYRSLVLMLTLSFIRGDHLESDRVPYVRGSIYLCEGVDSLLVCTCDGSDRDHSVVRFYLFVLKELIYSLFAFLMILFLFIWGRSPSIDLMGWSTHLHPQSPTSPEDEKFA